MNFKKYVILTMIGAGFVTTYAIAGDMQSPMMRQDKKMERWKTNLSNMYQL